MNEFSLASAFLAGLLGGVHCVGMCGGLVAAFSLPLAGGRRTLMLQVAANLGRLFTYVVLGVVAGALGAGTRAFAALLPVELALYALANAMLVLMGLYLAGLSTWVLGLERAGGRLWARLSPLLPRLLPLSTWPRALALGAMWGFLPCGLVYSVLVMALAQGNAALGGLTMAAFGLGTLPNLLAMGFLAARLRRWTHRPGVRRLAGLIVTAMGLVGFARLAGVYL